MHQWVDRYYPGTKLAITDTTGVAWSSSTARWPRPKCSGFFGRERLDLATLWGPPKPDQPGAYAFRLYRNYDGTGSRFGDISVQSRSSDPVRLAIYAAQRRADHALTLMILNKTAADLTSHLALAGFRPRSPARIYRYSPANLKAIVRGPDQAVSAAGFTATYPAYSLTLAVVPGRRG